MSGGVRVTRPSTSCIVAIGTPDELESEIGAEATMFDVFVKYAGDRIDAGEGHRDVAGT